MTVQPATTASNNRPPAPFTSTRRFGYGAAALALLVVVGSVWPVLAATGSVFAGFSAGQWPD